jgi:hypothetical protein
MHLIYIICSKPCDRDRLIPEVPTDHFLHEGEDESIGTTSYLECIDCEFKKETAMFFTCKSSGPCSKKVVMVKLLWAVMIALLLLLLGWKCVDTTKREQVKAKL